jgi:hypothetical protein
VATAQQVVLQAGSSHPGTVEDRVLCNAPSTPRGRWGEGQDRRPFLPLPLDSWETGQGVPTAASSGPGVVTLARPPEPAGLRLGSTRQVRRREALGGRLGLAALQAPAPQTYSKTCSEVQIFMVPKIRAMSGGVTGQSGTELHPPRPAPRPAAQRAGAVDPGARTSRRAAPRPIPAGPGAGPARRN